MLFSLSPLSRWASLSSSQKPGLKTRSILIFIAFIILAKFFSFVQSKIYLLASNPHSRLTNTLLEYESSSCRPHTPWTDTIEMYMRIQLQKMTPKDVAQIVLFSSQYSGAVVDVGANKGWPVTRLALKAGGRNVYSIEPDERNFKELRKLRFVSKGRSKRFKYHPVLGAAGREKGSAKMMFHKKRNDFTCMNCLDVKKENVFQKEVRVFSVDGVARDEGQILLLKTDTQGFELSVLRGSKRFLNGNKIRYMLIEFDPKLLRSKENALALLDFTHGHGLQCHHLKYVTREKEKVYLAFEDKIEPSSFGSFVDHLIANNAYTDLFCIRSPYCVL